MLRGRNPMQHDADAADRPLLRAIGTHDDSGDGLGGERAGEREEKEEGGLQGLNFPKSWGSIFSRYSLSLSASREGLGEGSSVSTPL